MPAGLSKGARGSHGLRLLVALLGTLVPLAPGLVSGCGGSESPTAPAPTTAIPADATIPLVTVVTGGGGAPTSSGGSSSGAVQNPLGDLPMPDGSSSGASSGSGSGAVSDDGSADSASLDGATSDGPVIENTTPHCPSDYVVSMCGKDPCDYRTSTCCVDIQLNTRCIPGNKSRCNSNEASIHCLQACECDTGRVCCGVANTILGIVTSECQSIPDGGLCNPHPMTNTQSSEQLCGTDEECTAGQGCINQTCEYGVTLKLCGLQSQMPFDCMAAM
jgi:hypothetical protein